MMITPWVKLKLALPWFCAACAIIMLLIETWNYQSWVGLIFAIVATGALVGGLGICICLGCMLMIWDD